MKAAYRGTKWSAKLFKRVKSGKTRKQNGKIWTNIHRTTKESEKGDS